MLPAGLTLTLILVVVVLILKKMNDMERANSESARRSEIARRQTVVENSAEEIQRKEETLARIDAIAGRQAMERHAYFFSGKATQQGRDEMERRHEAEWRDL